MLAPTVVLEARDVCFSYGGAHEFGLEKVSVALHPGRVCAFVGFNAQGKSTLCRILADVALPYAPRHSPSAGHVLYHPTRSATLERLDPYVSSARHSLLVACAVALALALASSVALVFGEVGCVARLSPREALVAGAVVCLLGLALETARARARRAAYRARVVYVSTEQELAKTELRDWWPLARAIAGPLRFRLGLAQRVALAERLLSWAGFRACTDDSGSSCSSSSESGSVASVVADESVVCGALSGGQRHLVYFLRALAPCFVDDGGVRPDVLVLDEALNCLDAEVLPRALRLVLEVAKRGVAVVLVTQVMHEVCAVCDEAVFVSDGRVVARGNARDLVDRDARLSGGGAHHAECERYARAYWDLEREMRLAAGKRGPAPCCGAELRAQIDALPELVEAGPPWERAKLERGENVVVVGLSHQRRFNGKAAVVVAQLDDDEGVVGCCESARRYKVRLSDAQHLSARRSNLQLAPFTARGKPLSSKPLVVAAAAQTSVTAVFLALLTAPLATLHNARQAWHRWRITRAFAAALANADASQQRETKNPKAD